MVNNEESAVASVLIIAKIGFGALTEQVQYTLTRVTLGASIQCHDSNVVKTLPLAYVMAVRWICRRLSLFGAHMAKARYRSQSVCYPPRGLFAVRVKRFERVDLVRTYRSKSIVGNEGSWLSVIWI